MQLAETNLSTLRLITDHAAFAELPQASQADILIKLGWLEQHLAAEHRRKGAIVAAAALALGISESAFNRYVARYQSDGWRGLIDKRIHGQGAKGLPEAFKEHVRGLHLQNQRSTTGREVHRQLVERWSKWRRTNNPLLAIPGYDAPPRDCGKGYPAGWSEDNIVRLRPDPYAQAAIRQGEKAAAKFLPSILKTRVGTRFGQVVFFDDQDYDTKVVAPGLSQKSLRPQGFNALDYHSGCFMQHCIRLRWFDATKQQYRTLTGRDYTWFQITYLQRHGYRQDTGTTLVQEHGTAKGFDNKELTTPQGHHSLADALLALSGGKIETTASGLYNKPVFAGMLLRPQSSGNPNMKAPLESMFNYVRNRFAGFIGATGLNRDMAPAEQYGADLYVKQMLKVWDELDERHRELIRWPLLTFSQFGEAAEAVYAAINARRDHDLEGWALMGHEVPLFRWTPDDRSPWLSQRELADLPDTVRAAASGLMELPGYTMPVKLAPIEVADLYRKELTTIPDHWIPLLIPVQWSREATVTSEREIIIKDQLLGPEPFVYIARFRRADSVETLKPGTRLRCYLNPFDTSKLYVCRADGSWLGVLLNRTRGAWGDTEALMGQLHERAEIKADLDLEVRPHLQGLIQQRGEMDRVNKRLRDKKPTLPEEIAAARSAAAMQGQRTAAANRLQGMAEDIDWDATSAHDIGPDSLVTTAEDDDPYSGLPDDADFSDD